MKVAVIGAGMAGLAAAVQLTLAGIEPLVLEASGRVGGRVKVVDYKGQKAHLGANWIHCATKANPLLQFLQSKGRLLETDSSESDNCEYKWSEFYKAGGRKVSGETLQTAISIFESAIEEIERQSQRFLVYRLRPSSCSSSHAQLLQQSGGDSADEPRTSLEKALEKICDERLKQLSPPPPDDGAELKCILESLKINYSPFVGETFDKVRAEMYYTEGDGPDILLPTDLMDEFTSELVNAERSILFNHKVTKIEWSDQGVTIGCETDDVTFKADYVICTLPIGVLQKSLEKESLFRPPLPEAKVEAIMSLNSGAIAKYLFDWKAEDGDDIWWWTDKKSPIIFVGQNDAAEARIADWIKGVCVVIPPDGDCPLLMTFMAGQSALQADLLEDQQVKRDFGQGLRFFLGNESIPDPDVLIRERWTTSPLSLGAYCTPGLKSKADTFHRIAEPLPGSDNPRLSFAGEATSPNLWSYLHGAQTSGVKAADAIISKIGGSTDYSAS